MKIGILTYHYVYNFGANLQALSTLYYFLSRGYEAKIINWQPDDIRNMYDNMTELLQRKAHENVWQFYALTDLCVNNEEVIDVIKKEKFDAVVIGSDAVLQYRPILPALRPTRKLKFGFSLRMKDQQYPNPYLGLIKGENLKIVYMSVSAQNAPIRSLTFLEKMKIRNYLKGVVFMAVRDTWTQDYIRIVSDGNIMPPITPDPVFAFNWNCEKLLEREEIIFWDKYSFLKDKNYILVSFKEKFKPKQVEWINIFEKAANQKGYDVFSLPYPQEHCYDGLCNRLELPMSPLEWYFLIKYSKGYVGNNMHPIVSSIHNKIPFFVFDNYAKKNRVKGIAPYSSKIFDLLNSLCLLDYYYNINDKNEPAPYEVLGKLINFNNDLIEFASNMMLIRYKLMMKHIEDALKSTN